MADLLDPVLKSRERLYRGEFAGMVRVPLPRVSDATFSAFGRNTAVRRGQGHRDRPLLKLLQRNVHQRIDIA
jgi:hypothetical protein